MSDEPREAGPELDAWVAERFLGYSGRVIAAPYSTSTAAAMEWVWPELVRRGCHPILTSANLSCHQVDYALDEPYIGSTSECKTIALAVCLAAVGVVEAT